jgi:PAS domain S-box-containing protein
LGYDEELRSLFAAIQDYAIYTLTPEGMIRAWNSGSERLHGYSRDEIVGKYFGVLYPKEGIDVGSADFQLKFTAEHGRYIREGWQTRKDGTRFWAYCVTTVLRDDVGQLRGYAKVTLDITQRKQVSDELLESHAFIQQIITSAPQGIVVYDKDLRYRVWNPYMEWLTGLAENEVLGQQPWELFPFLQKYGVDLMIRRALNGETLEGEPIRYQVGEDHKGWSAGVWSPLRDSQGSIIGTLGFVRDLTEHVNAQERLQMLSRRLLTAQEQERRKLAIELHDEVGQVLTAVTLNLQSLHKDATPTGRKQVEECVQIVQQAIQQVREMSINLRPSLLDDLGLQPALRWYLDQQSQRATFVVELKCEVKKGQVSGDIETACFRLVQESVTNVVRHARARKVSVSVDLLQQTLQLEIRDDGVGFDVVVARARATQGLSCGIQGMQERAELLGGTLTIESLPGQGTLLTASFPLEQNPPVVLRRSETLPEIGETDAGNP